MGLVWSPVEADDIKFTQPPFALSFIIFKSEVVEFEYFSFSTFSYYRKADCPCFTWLAKSRGTKDFDDLQGEQ